jgi:hypothetical protein
LANVPSLIYQHFEGEGKDRVRSSFRGSFKKILVLKKQRDGND